MFSIFLQEARLAIEQVVIPKGEPVELLPRPFHIMLLQRELIWEYKLQSIKVGTESEMRLRILPFQASVNEGRHSSESDGEDNGLDDFISNNNGTNGMPYTVDRLPLLPE